MLAHRDFDLATGNSAKPVEDATIEKVRAAINALADILNALSQHYLKATTLFHFTDAAGGAVSLIQALRRHPKE
jgi:tRNA U34 5-methylaminomethyl-2-thiouridine-forming methyltransferase MnmC